MPHQFPTPRSVAGEGKLPLALPGDLQIDFQIVSGEQGRQPPGPFHRHHLGPGEIFFQVREHRRRQVFQAVEVQVDQRHAPGILMHQGEAGAGDQVGRHLKPLGQTVDELGLAAAQLTV